MNVYVFYVRRILKRPLTLVLALLLPVALTYGVVLQYESATKFSVTLSISDPELHNVVAGELTRSGVDFVDVNKAERGSARGVVIALDQTLEQIQVDPAAFAPVISSSSPSAISGLLVARANTVLSSVRFIAENSPTEASLANALTNFEDQPEAVETSTNVTGNENSLVVVSTFNMIVFVMLLLTMTNILMFLKDKEFTTTQRVLVATGRKLSYYVQIVLVFATLGIAELALMVEALQWIYGVPLNVSWQGLGTVVLAYALLNVFIIELGLLIVSQTTKQSVARIAVTAVVLPLSMLGGALWPLSIMPEWMQSVARVLPTTWVTELNRTIFSGFEADPWDIARPLLLLCLASAALFVALSRVPSDKV